MMCLAVGFFSQNQAQHVYLPNISYSVVQWTKYVFEHMELHCRHRSNHYNSVAGYLMQMTCSIMIFSVPGILTETALTQ